MLILFLKIEKWFPIERLQNEYGPFSVTLNNGDTFTEDLQSYEYSVKEKVGTH